MLCNLAQTIKLTSLTFKVCEGQATLNQAFVIGQGLGLSERLKVEDDDFKVEDLKIKQHSPS